MSYLCLGGGGPNISKSELSDQQRRNDEIELELAEDGFQERKNIKLLLLGAGECGKTTFLKQMQLMHNQITESDYESVKKTIYANIIESIGTILTNMIKMGIPFENPERVLDREAVFDVIENEEHGNRFTIDVYEGIVLLWQDKGVKRCFERRSEYYLLDSAEYFFNDLDRIHSPNYVPMTQDFLYARRQTLGIVKIGLPVLNKETGSNVTLRVFDVGGQRNERRKWIHCFDDVNSVIFITAISEFDQMMREDNVTNRMIDSLSLFKYVTSSVYFRNAFLILFLNKIDIFRAKIESNISIKKLFDDYNGGQNYEESLRYITDQFLARKPEDKVVFTHCTCATDSSQAQKVITSCVDMIMNKAVSGSGME